MARYVALIDGQEGGWGVAFPDAPGCTAMGATVDEALKHSVLALAEWASHSEAEGLGLFEPRSADALRADPEVAEQLAEGAVMAVLPLLRESGRAVRANLSIDAGMLAAIDEAANAAGLTRSAFLASAARDKILGSI